MAGQGNEPSRGAPKPRKYVRSIGWVIVALCAAFALLVALVPVPREATSPSLVYDESGEIVGPVQANSRIPVPIAQVPLALQNATVATEDASFYRNFGIDPLAILRAALVDLRAQRIVEGGSTITQQLAKNLFLTQRRTIGRKLQEVVYTIRLEATHSKIQILDMYLNTVYYGASAWGVGAAAETYFDKPVSELDLAQSALLAGLPQAPAALNPFQHFAAAKARQQLVLSRMAQLGYITQAQAAAAAAEPLVLRHGSTAVTPSVGYFIAYAMAQIGAHNPRLQRAVEAGGYRVYTTMNLTMQAKADEAFTQYMPPGTPDASGVLEPQGALVAIDPTNGAVRALIGGRSFALDPFNRAVDAVRQPGSTFKAFLYSTVIADGYPVTARQFDGPVSFPNPGGKPFVPHDDTGYTYQWLTMRDAVAVSDNVVAVKWNELVGPKHVIQTARRMGITSPLQPTLPLVLGAYGVTPLQMASAYVPLANLGTAYAPWSVRKVVNAEGITVWQPNTAQPKPALDPGVAYIVTNLFQSVLTSGTGRKLLPIVGRTAAGKTGTTSSLKDAWFVGYTPQLVTAVWVGDDTPANLGGYGSGLAGPIWAHFMALALADTPNTTWTMPADVTICRVSAIDGLLPNPSSPTVEEVFLKKTVPTKVSPTIGTGGITPGITGLPGSSIQPPTGLTSASRSGPLGALSTSSSS